MDTPNISSILKKSLLAAIVGASFSVQAAGLGKLTVFSAIGQPLNAEVSLSASAEELGSLSAKMASHEAFKEAGIDFMPALTGVKFALAKNSGGQPVLKLTTSGPLNEPFMQLLVELNWTAGRMVREYTFLLDPPEAIQPQQKPAAVVRPLPPVEAVRGAPAAASVPPAAPVPQVTVKPSGGEVKVKPGDTLSKIALDNLPPSVSLDQMLVALFNQNRDVFDGENMNRLRAGKIIRLPDVAAAANVDPREARKMVISQTADFNAYRRVLAEAAGRMPVAAPAEPRQQASGRIEPKMEAKAPPAPPADKLEVSRTDIAKTLQNGKGKLEEELVSRDKALREASERIAQLEKNIEGLKQLAELKSQAGARLQQQSQAAPPAVAATTQPAAKPADAGSAGVASAPTGTGVEGAKPPVPKPSPAPAAQKPAPASPPPAEPSFVEDNPGVVFGGGGVLALLLGYLGYSALRRKKSQAAANEMSPGALGVAAGAREPAVDAEKAMPAQVPIPDDVSILGDFSETGLLTAEEIADPVAEADVLMAYGRDGQAEEILLDGLKTDPGRLAIHVKLLEIYAHRKDATNFQQVAGMLHDRCGGRGGEWSRACALAAELGLSGGLFVVASTASALDEDAPITEAPADTADASSETDSASNASPVLPESAAEVDDFDLDLRPTNDAPVDTGANDAVAQPAADEAASLDFDFDLGDDVTPGVSAQTAPMASGDTRSEQVSTQIIDFSLDSDEEKEVSPPAVQAEVLAPVALGNEIDFDLGSLDEPAHKAGLDAMPAAESIDPPIDLGLAEISLDLELPSDSESSANAEPAASVMPEVEFPALDLSLETETSKGDFDLELGVSAVLNDSSPVQDALVPALEGDSLDTFAPASPVSMLEASLDGVPEAGMTAPEIADDPEVATKLELAQAYEEMGDHEGARELLNEVLNEGSPSQQAQARARLDLLSI